MTLSAGTVTIAEDASYSGDGAALLLFEALDALQAYPNPASTPEGFSENAWAAVALAAKLGTRSFLASLARGLAAPTFMREGGGASTPLNPRGAWTTATVYDVGDVVVSAGNGYACVTAHTSSGANTPPHAEWALVVSAGATGPTGATGPAGPAGAVGPAGPAGPTGPTGANGANGLDGATGATGPSGAAGSAGPAGANGINAFCTTTAPFTQPNGTPNWNVQIQVDSTAILVATMPVAVEGAGYYTVLSVDSSTLVTLTWTQVGAPAGFGVASGKRVFFGEKGATGAAGANGATGTAGTNGATGATGASAFTTTTASFTQPNAASPIPITVGSTAWMTVGQTIYIATGGSYTVTSIANATDVTVSWGGYDGSVGTGGTVAANSLVTGAGPRGADGATGANGATGTTGPSGRPLAMTRLTATGSSTHTTQPTTAWMHIRAIGGGGGGGGVTSAASSGACAGGGGSGAFAEWWVAATGSTGYTYQCGSAGTAGANTGGTGGTGGSTTITVDGVTLTCAGGAGGVGQTAGTAVAVVAGGAGAAVATLSAGSPTLAAGGTGGQWAHRHSATIDVSGAGAGSPLGGGGAGRVTGGAGNNATGYGAGGGGAACVSASGAQVGGTGSQGCIIITEYA